MVDLYTIRTATGWDGAQIVIDEQSGLFMAHGSFGTYAYCWTHIGAQTLKQFLTGLDFGYFMEKTFGRGYRIFDADETTKSLRSEIKRRRRDDDLTKQQARDAWVDLDLYLGESSDHEHAYITEMCRSEALMRVAGDEYYDVGVLVDNPSCRGFWNEIWPLFLADIAQGEAA